MDLNANFVGELWGRTWESYNRGVIDVQPSGTFQLGDKMTLFNEDEILVHGYFHVNGEGRLCNNSKMTLRNVDDGAVKGRLRIDTDGYVAADGYGNENAEFIQDNIEKKSIINYGYFDVTDTSRWVVPAGTDKHDCITNYRSFSRRNFGAYLYGYLLFMPQKDINEFAMYDENAEFDQRSLDA